MPRRSQRRFSQSVAKSRAASSRIERTQYSPARRFDSMFTPVARREFIDEGNKALRRLLERDLGYQRAQARIAAERFVFSPRRRPPRGVQKGVPKVAPPRVASILTLPGRTDSVQTLKKVRDAVICAGRQIRRELVFASGSAGQNRKVPSRARPSSVRC